MKIKNKVVPVIVFALSGYFFTSVSHATQIVNVPDSKFHICLNNYLKQPIANAPITDTQLESLTGQIGCDEMGVADITGAEYLVNITFFNIEDNQLTSLTPIAGLTQLTRLQAGGNHITNGDPLKNMVNMQDLDLNNNDLSDGDFVAGMKSIESLDLSSNNIRSISGAEGLTNLKNLYLQGSRMNDISNFSGLTQLVQLNLADNGISDLSVLSGMRNLTSVYLDRQDVQINPLPNTGALTISDPVINVDDSPIPPTTISNDGVYENGQIVWSAIPAGTDSVTFTFSQNVSIDGMEIPFSGSVTQYLE